ncbi:MAG: LptF/LptG family permease [Verrucomicrobia bacterium]|nr:LptF/LptG family permease [Verrucomicrobiota bacterium]
MKLWERHCLKELIKTLLIVLGCFYLIFVVIDYAFHTKAFSAGELPLALLAQYYSYQFSKQLQLLLPFALLLSSIKVLTTLNLHNELVALLAAGLPAKKLVRPLAMMGILCTALLWANSEWVFPRAIEKTEHFDRTYFHGGKNDGHHLHTVQLKDGSMLLYQNWDSTREAFFDVFWLQEPTKIYRMRYLKPLKNFPLGLWVDELSTDQEGLLQRTASWPMHYFPKMEFDDKELFTAMRPPEQMRLSLLWLHRPSKEKQRDRDHQLLTQLNLKLALPLICLFVALLPAAACLRFSRRPPVFLIYALAIGAYLTFLTAMDAVAILGEAGVFSPLWVIWTPIALLFCLTCWRFARI